jgi:pyruvate/2-oxoglutarate dehydrogenase complex dihydrolipoamide acyltransferase (E2) component
MKATSMTCRRDVEILFTTVLAVEHAERYRAEMDYPEKTTGYNVVKYPKHRFPTIDYLRVARNKPLIHLFMEADVTLPRTRLRTYRRQTGQGLSFTAFLVGCLAQAIDENKRVQAYRTRRKLVIFEEVDACVIIEQAVGEARLPVPHVIRAANRRDLLGIHKEIRRCQEAGAREADPWRLSRFYPFFPGFLRRLFWRALFSNPWWMKRIPGTVCVTAAGMFGKGPGWGVPISAYTLTLTVGGIGPRLVMQGDETVEREYLSLTLSFDHEIVDGAPAARFADRLRQLIESAHGLNAKME